MCLSMVKNGKNKHCQICYVNRAMSHRIKKTYLCFECADIRGQDILFDSKKYYSEMKLKDKVVTDLIHLVCKLGNDLKCHNGRIMDNNYIYDHMTEPRKMGDGIIPDGWEYVQCDRFSCVEITIIAKPISSYKKKILDRISDYDIYILGLNMDWEKSRLELPLNKLQEVT